MNKIKMYKSSSPATLERLVNDFLSTVNEVSVQYQTDQYNGTLNHFVLIHYREKTDKPTYEWERR